MRGSYMSRITINPDEIINWFESREDRDKYQVIKLAEEVENIYRNYSKAQITIFENLMMYGGLIKKYEPNLLNSNRSQ